MEETASCPGRASGLGTRVAIADAEVFRGRRTELDALVTRLADQSALPGVVCVSGVAGIGKAALCHELQRRCEARGLARAVIVDSRDLVHCRLQTTTGQTIELGTFGVSNAYRSWGSTVAINPATISIVRLVSGHGQVLSEAKFDSAAPRRAPAPPGAP